MPRKPCGGNPFAKPAPDAAPALVASSEGVLQWEWSGSNPDHWEIWIQNSLSEPQTLLDTVAGVDREYAPDGGSEFYRVRGATALNVKETPYSNKVRPDDFFLPTLEAPLLDFEEGTLNATVAKSAQATDPDQWSFAQDETEPDPFTGEALALYAGTFGAEDSRPPDDDFWVAHKAISNTFAAARYRVGIQWSPWSVVVNTAP